MDLTGLELRLSCDIARDGYAACDAAELCQDKGILTQLSILADTFAKGEKVAWVRDSLSKGIVRQTFKPFVVKYQEIQSFTSDHPLYRFGMLPAMQRIVNECVGESMRFFSGDLWYVLPNAADKDRSYGSAWHRDPEDKNTVKAYLFLTDVTPASGPIEYVVGSHRADSKYAAIGAPQRYAPQEQVDEIPDCDKRRFCYPAGTLLFFHSGGLHRGGYTRGQPRVNTVWTYVPEGALLPNNFTLKDNARSSNYQSPVAV